jgi:hypothetical protein
MEKKNVNNSFQCQFTESAPSKKKESTDRAFMYIMVSLRERGTHLSKSIREQPMMKICSRYIAEVNKNDEPT